MKGIVFTEFMELVEGRMGLEMLDRIITEAKLPNDGAYTSVGTYDHAELVRLVQALSDASGVSMPQLIHMFGEHLFQRFSVSYQPLFADSHSAFDFLSHIDDVIHVEVRKLYPDAELPSLPCERPSPDRLLMHYSSPRGLGDLAEGLIAGCIKHFGENIAVTRTDLPKEGALHRARFELVRRSA
ncbi:heme NO-binding domain-containing protein [Duganella sp. Root1480D1]|uniref:heme NO-binding domain-containing protein n=1 Tax=Duganella sp. Root1480D1 TaxID=1736471 RepID=UPI00070F1769|nr:heme NO-binding domain-containing protein [Duganella sp. Root1480D1]KQZ39948.1 hypothetical protein ASD58_06085 [Duganella sp. Root1480D1]